MDVKATEGDTMLDLAQRYDIDLECKYLEQIGEGEWLTGGN